MQYFRNHLLYFNELFVSKGPNCCLKDIAEYFRAQTFNGLTYVNDRSKSMPTETFMYVYQSINFFGYILFCDYKKNSVLKTTDNNRSAVVMMSD